MSSKYFLALHLILLTSACGVKSDPIPPEGSILPSILEEYTQSEAKNTPDKNADQEKSKNKKNQ